MDARPFVGVVTGRDRLAHEVVEGEAPRLRLAHEVEGAERGQPAGRGGVARGKRPHEVVEAGAVEGLRHREHLEGRALLAVGVAEEAFEKAAEVSVELVGAGRPALGHADALVGGDGNVEVERDAPAPCSDDGAGLGLGHAAGEEVLLGVARLEVLDGAEVETALPRGVPLLPPERPPPGHDYHDAFEVAGEVAEPAIRFLPRNNAGRSFAEGLVGVEKEDGAACGVLGAPVPEIGPEEPPEKGLGLLELPEVADQAEVGLAARGPPVAVGSLQAVEKAWDGRDEPDERDTRGTDEVHEQAAFFEERGLRLAEREVGHAEPPVVGEGEVEGGKGDARTLVGGGAAEGSAEGGEGVAGVARVGVHAEVVVGEHHPVPPARGGDVIEEGRLADAADPVEGEDAVPIRGARGERVVEGREEVVPVRKRAANGGRAARGDVGDGHRGRS